MKFNPITKTVYTDRGKFIKKLECPFRIDWDSLQSSSGNNKLRTCSQCDHKILDTAFYSDSELFDLLQKFPETCLKINLNQNNVKIISNGNGE